MKNAFVALFAAFLALSFFGGASEAYAAEPAGHSFCKGGMGNPEELAARVTRSLAQKADGSAPIEKCAATPAHLLVSFQELNPKAKAAGRLNTVSQLPGFIEKLVVVPSEPGMEYNSACLYERADGTLYVKLGCVTRELRGAEVRYADPETGVVVLMQDCVNPGGSQMTLVVEGGCIEIKSPAMGTGIAKRFAYIGRTPLPGKCHKYLLSGEPKPLYDTPEECPDVYDKIVDGRKVRVVCSWDEVEAAASENLGFTAEVQNVSGSYYTRADGTDSWFLPVEALDGESVICWELPDGTFVTIGVRREHFVDGVAVITPAVVEGAR